MKSISSAMAAHLQQEVTTLCTCWRIACKDETVFTFTDHDVDITVDGELYTSALGYQRTAITSDSQFSPDNLDVHGILDSSSITAADLRAGKFDYATVEIFAINYNDLTMGKIKLRFGWFGETERTPTGLFRAELRGIGQALAQKWGQTYSPACRADFGDKRCTYPSYPDPWKVYFNYKVGDHCSFPAPATDIEYISDFTCTSTTSPALSGNVQPAFSFVPGATITEGGITWTTRTQFRRVAYVTSINANDRTQIFCTGLTASLGPFENGVLHWINGNNHGKTTEIKRWTPASYLLDLWLPQPYPIVVGDRFMVVPGCSKKRSACMFYGNILNYRGEPDVPGIDMLTRYPQAH